MPKYTVKSPLNHDGDLYEVGQEFETSDIELAAKLCGDGVLDIHAADSASVQSESDENIEHEYRELLATLDDDELAKERQNMAPEDPLLPLLDAEITARRNPPSDADDLDIETVLTGTIPKIVDLATRRDSDGVPALSNEEVEALLAAERAGKNRTTLTAALEEEIATRAGTLS